MLTEKFLIPLSIWILGRIIFTINGKIAQIENEDLKFELMESSFELEKLIEPFCEQLGDIVEALKIVK